MALALCGTQINEQGRELVQHGTLQFPIACYHDDLAKSPVPWPWHLELEVFVISEGMAVVAVGAERFALGQGQAGRHSFCCPAARLPTKGGGAVALHAGTECGRGGGPVRLSGRQLFCQDVSCAERVCALRISQTKAIELNITLRSAPEKISIECDINHRKQAVMMISFANDYIAGAHPQILKRLMETNLEPLPGYGEDAWCVSAKQKVCAACGCSWAQVEFLTGGTQTNQLVISTMLREHEGVIAAKTGHVSTHEAGAIEYSGHKVLDLPQRDGKLDAGEVERYIRDFYADENREHMVFPGMVYISHPTEYGTLYRKKELEALSRVCRAYGIPLYLDGARLGYGLMSRETDVALADIAALCDVFYIGGTKVGALCGEAVVFTQNNRPPHFTNSVKKRGALLAKGRLLGVQFDTLFTDGLYFELSKHAIEMAEQLKTLLHEKGVEFYLESPTNQQFVILDDRKIEALKTQVSFSFWEKYGPDRTVVRFATSWSTTVEDLEFLRSVL